MRFNKLALSAAVAAALGSTSALAVVNLDTGANGPVYYASEITMAAAGTPLASVGGGVTDATVTLGIAVGAGQNVYARFDLDNGAKFTAAPACAVVPAAACALVSGGAATSFAIFQITAPAGGSAAADVITITTAGFTTTSTTPVSMRYRLFGNQGNAQDLVGTPNKDAAKGFLGFADSYALTVAAITPVSTSDVAAVPSFTKFLNNQTTARIGPYTLKLTEPNGVGAPTYTAAGAPVANVGTLLAATSKLTVAGSFTARAAANGVQRAGLFACPGGVAATPITDTQADFGTLPLGGITAVVPLAEDVCYTVNGTATIPASDYTVSLAAVANAGYTVKNLGPLLLGRIVRNGTELQAPIGQVINGWGSRIVLTNTGTIDRPYTVRVMPGTGSPNITPGPVVGGTIPAGQFITQDVSELINTPSSQTFNLGATVVVTVVAPDTDIQGLYQLWQVSTGNITNTPMVRPGQ